MGNFIVKLYQMAAQIHRYQMQCHRNGKKKQSRSNQLDDCGKFVKLLSRLIVCLLNQNSIDVQIFLFKETAQQGVSAESEFEQQSESIRTHRKLICPLENCSHSVFPLQSLAKCSRW